MLLHQQRTLVPTVREPSLIKRITIRVCLITVREEPALIVRVLTARMVAVAHSVRIAATGPIALVLTRTMKTAIGRSALMVATVFIAVTALIVRGITVRRMGEMTVLSVRSARSNVPTMLNSVRTTRGLTARMASSVRARTITTVPLTAT